MSIGEINKNNRFNDFYYINQTDTISPGTPIFNLSNNKLIGIHKGFNAEKKKNIGLFFSYFIQKFIYDEKDKQFIKSFTTIQPKYKKRILVELNAFNKEKIDKYVIYPIVENMTFLRAIIFGPEGSPYENGKFFVDIVPPIDYPLKPPTFYFRTKIFHPNFKNNDNKICSCVIEDLGVKWNATMNISKIINEIYSLLKNPNKNPKIVFIPGLHLINQIHANCFNNECLEMMKGNEEKYKKIASEWTLKYA